MFKNLVFKHFTGNIKKRVSKRTMQRIRDSERDLKLDVDLKDVGAIQGCVDNLPNFKVLMFFYYIINIIMTILYITYILYIIIITNRVAVTEFRNTMRNIQWYKQTCRR